MARVQGYQKQMQTVCADNIVNHIGKLKDMRKTVVVAPPTADGEGAQVASVRPVGVSGDRQH